MSKINHQRQFRFFLAIAPNLEEIVAAEVQSHLLDTDTAKLHLENGGISFRVSMEEGISLLQKLRTPNKMLMRLSTKKTTSISDIATLLNKAQLDELVLPNTPCTVVVHSNKSKLYRRDIVEQKALRVLNGIMGKPNKDARLLQKLQIRIDRDLATLSIQVHKGHLYQRGWRTQQGKASLRENLASVLLQTANWNPNQTLLDPFCGSGTIAIEAARFKMGLPTRIFQSENWHQWKPFVHQEHISTNPSRYVTQCDGIFASDKHQPAVDASVENSRIGGVSFSIEKRDVGEIEPPTKEGLIICNPPYGLRLGQNVDAVYRCMGQRWRERFCDADMNWKMVFLCPNFRLARLVDKRVRSVYQFSQGGLNVHICMLEKDTITL